VCDVTKTKIRFSRRGSGKSDTVYILMPIVNEPISPKVQATIDAIPLNILDGKKSTVENGSQYGNGGYAPSGPEPVPESDELSF
jgi:hypothetical protein